MAGLVETHLVRREGDHVMFLSPLRGVPDAGLSYRLPLNGQSVSAQALRQRLGGLQLGQDPLGRQALAYALPVRHTDWMLVASADEATAYALVRRLEIIAIALMSFILLLTVAWFAQWQRRQRTMHQAREMQIRLAGEERFHTVFDHVALAMARHALNGDIMEVNDNWCTTFGYTREELAERKLNWQQLTYPEDVEVSAGKVKRLLAGELTDIQMEKRYVRKNGEVFWGEVRISLVHDERGVPDYFISAVQEISERKRLKEERNANLMLLQMALDAAQEAVWEWDLETGQARFSPEYYTMLGYLPDEFPSNRECQVFCV